ncbi:MAG: MurT ligase domain-containing protein [Coriobacteriia bacterium]|nr:MurT ligase domain-containing protein [Coriobacteriia bacterium]
MRTIAILIARFVAAITRLAGNSGTSLPGMIVTKLDRNILRKLAGEVKRGIIVVTGTNGKTTTANTCRALLEDAGYRVISNREGANMYNGVVTAFLLEAPLSGKLEVDYAVLESDELYTVQLCAELTQKYFVVTNLFSDQEDRLGGVDQVRNTIARALKHAISPDTVLILNQDNPDSAKLSESVSQKTVFFSTESLAAYHASEITEEETLSFIAHTPEQEAHIVTNIRGRYNVSNILAAIAVATSEGVSLEQCAKTLKGYHTQPGRMERFMIEDKPVILNMAKNPAGFNRSMESADVGPGTFDVYLVTNNEVADGVDISWYREIEFERWEKEGPINIYVGGECREEMAERIRNSGVKWSRIRLVDNPAEGLHKALNGAGKTLYVFANYSAVFDLRKELEQRI